MHQQQPEVFYILQYPYHNHTDHPQYTKPAVFEDMPVPEVLLSGNHKLIETWRQEQALANTRRKRPDLLTHNV